MKFYFLVNFFFFTKIGVMKLGRLPPPLYVLSQFFYWGWLTLDCWSCPFSPLSVDIITIIFTLLCSLSLFPPFFAGSASISPYLSTVSLFSPICWFCPYFPPFVPRNCPMRGNESELGSELSSWITMGCSHGQFTTDSPHLHSATVVIRGIPQYWIDLLCLSQSAQCPIKSRQKGPNRNSYILWLRCGPCLCDRQGLF